MNDYTGFLSTLCSVDIGYWNNRLVRELMFRPLIWVNGPKAVVMSPGFQSDGASVPRLLFFYYFYGEKVHRKGFLHDYLYRKGARIYWLKPSADVARLRMCQTVEEFHWFTSGWYLADKKEADWMFRASLKSDGRSWFLYQGMWAAVRLGGDESFHKYNVMDKLPIDRAL